MALTLVIGNKNYSSWSFRPWIAMKVAGIAFDEVVISLDAAGLQAAACRKSPAPARCRRWTTTASTSGSRWRSWNISPSDFPAAKLWPADPAARAQARAISSEMHAGFVPLRRACPMNMWRPVKKRELDAEAHGQRPAHRGDVGRLPRPVTAPAGRFCSAHSAPPTPCMRRWSSRFHTYDVEVGAPTRAYMDAVMALPAWAEWTAAALKEPWVLAEDEVDWPTVLQGLIRRIDIADLGAVHPAVDRRRHDPRPGEARQQRPPGAVEEAEINAVLPVAVSPAGDPAADRRARIIQNANQIAATIATRRPMCNLLCSEITRKAEIAFPVGTRTSRCHQAHGSCIQSSSDSRHQPRPRRRR